MLWKQEEKKEKVKDEAYCVMNIEEHIGKSINLSLAVKTSIAKDRTY